MHPNNAENLHAQSHRRLAEKKICSQNHHDSMKCRAWIFYRYKKAQQQLSVQNLAKSWLNSLVQNLAQNVRVLEGSEHKRLY